MLTNCSDFFGHETTTATHTFGLNFILKLWAESLVLMSVDYAWPLPETNSTTVCNLYCLWVACPCLSLSAVAMCALHRLRSGFPSSWCWALAVALHWQGAGHETIRGHSLSLHEISKCSHFKFRMAASKQAINKATKQVNMHMQVCTTIMWYRRITLLASSDWLRKLQC